MADTSLVEPSGPLKVSLTELAKLKSVSTQAISKRLKKLEGEGLIRSEKFRGTVRVALAEWDRVTGETTDLARSIGAATRAAAAAPAGDEPAAAKADPTYTNELTRKARYDADLKKLEIDRQRGELVRIDDVRDAMAILAETMVRDIEQLPTMAEAVLNAGKTGELAGTRDALRRCARDLRERLDRSLAAVDVAPGAGEAAA